MSELLTGYLPDPPDARDRPAAILLGSLNTPQRVRERVLPMRPARAQVGNSCVANAWIHSLETLALLDGRLPPALSAQALYYWARHRDGLQATDAGSHLRSAAWAAKTLGVPLERDWPAMSSTLVKAPTWVAAVSAYERRIEGYFRPGVGDVMLDQLEAAILRGHPCIVGIPIGHEWANYVGGSLSMPQRITGWHAVALMGVYAAGAARRWLAINSWGDRWGFKGTCLLDDELVRHAQDAWIAA